MRIASLLPSATEIVCALDARDDLVGRSHECDYPPGLDHIPILTRARLAPPTPATSSRDIHAAVQDAIRPATDALAIYDIDLPALRTARPDVIVTQDLCHVCAVSLDDVRSAVARLASHDVEIISLSPTRLDHIYTDVERVGAAIGRAQAGRTLVTDLKGRVAAIAARAAAIQPARRPSVLTIEWIDPVMIGGLWMPELVTLAAGTPLVTAPGQHAPTLTFDHLAALDPDVVLVKPCGFTLKRTLRELATLRRVLPWDSWRAVAAGRVYVGDGSAFFNRPGPRIVESLEIMAACVWPDGFADFAEKHRGDVVRVDRELRVSEIAGAGATL